MNLGFRRALLFRGISSPLRTQPIFNECRSSSSVSNEDHHHEHKVIGYEPGGYLFGIPPGVKRKPYFWEYMWYVGYILPLVIFGIAEYMAPKKRSIIHSSKVEAHRRMSERGETFGWPFPPDYSLVDSKKY